MALDGLLGDAELLRDVVVGHAVEFIEEKSMAAERREFFESGDEIPELPPTVERSLHIGARQGYGLYLHVIVKMMGTDVFLPVFVDRHVRSRSE